MMNKLYHSDCLTLMQKQMDIVEIDLIYLDSPLCSKKTYNAIYKNEPGVSGPIT